MGVSIDLHIYDYFELTKKIVELSEDMSDEARADGRTANFFIEKILPEFGVRAGDKFVTLWNEYYEDYNTGYEVMRAVDMYFGTEETFLYGYDYGQSVNARELFYDMELKSLHHEDADE